MMNQFVEKNFKGIIAIAVIAISFSVFYGLVWVPYNKDEPYRECLRMAGEHRRLVEDSLNKEYDSGKLTDEEMSHKINIILDGYEAARDRCIRNYR